jgi:hypothetical protein
VRGVIFGGVVSQVIVELLGAPKLVGVVEQPPTDLARLLVGFDRKAAPGARWLDADVPAEGVTPRTARSARAWRASSAWTYEVNGVPSTVIKPSWAMMPTSTARMARSSNGDMLPPDDGPGGTRG